MQEGPEQDGPVPDAEEPRAGEAAPHSDDADFTLLSTGTAGHGATDAVAGRSSGHGYLTVGLASLASLAVFGTVPWAGTLTQVTVCILLAALFGFAWPQYLAIPARKTLGGIIAAVGALAVVGAAVVPGPGFMAWSAPLIALGLMAVLLVELIRGTGQPQRLESTFGASAGVLLAALGAGWVANVRLGGLRDMIVIVVVCAAVAVAVGLIRWPDRIVAPLAVVLSVLVGPLVGFFDPYVAALPSALLGLVAGLLVVCFRRLITFRVHHASLVGAVALGLGPILALGSVGYFVGKLLLV
ncbi:MULTISPECIES: permease [Arthrobacter]|uniref:Permease n=2 Tax=Arthrobacter TaxID=1663 RepID=A0ABU9KN05_9MICC|nr:permease [Arthrobacter sp. YJM1]MDP5227914.1 permease [Arthrobacter sp. YJM1]